MKPKRKYTIVIISVNGKSKSFSIYEHEEAGKMNTNSLSTLIQNNLKELDKHN